MLRIGEERAPPVELVHRAGERRRMLHQAVHRGLRDLEHDGHLERGHREGLGLIGHDRHLAEERSRAEHQDAHLARGQSSRALLDRAAQHHVEPLVKLALAAELFAGNELAQGDREEQPPQIGAGPRRRRSGPGVSCSARPSSIQPDGVARAPNWRGSMWSGTASSTFILLKRTMSARLRSAGHAGTHWRHWVHADKKSTTPVVRDHRQVHRGIELGDRDRGFSRAAGRRASSRCSRCTPSPRARLARRGAASNRSRRRPRRGKSAPVQNRRVGGEGLAAARRKLRVRGGAANGSPAEMRASGTGAAPLTREATGRNCSESPRRAGVALGTRRSPRRASALGFQEIGENEMPPRCRARRASTTPRDR